MSCEGWSVGDQCQTIAAFKIVQHQMNGPDIVHALNQGDEGKVFEIIHEQPHHHWLSIYWHRTQRKLAVPEEQFKYLKRMY
jgi:hypothetical protein